MDLTGQRFGRYFVKEVGEPYISQKSGEKYKRYFCICDCGNERLVRESSLWYDNVESCGCKSKEDVTIRNTTHGHSKHPLYGTWVAMNRRCYSKNSKDFKHYGARGIEVCERWKRKWDKIENGFLNFLSDMEKSFKGGLEIDRIDVNKNYEPSNCQWATRKQQVINRRTAKLLEFSGITMCMSQWSEILGINMDTLTARVGKLGWSVEKALTTPIKSTLGSQIDLRKAFKGLGVEI